MFYWFGDFFPHYVFQTKSTKSHQTDTVSVGAGEFDALSPGVGLFPF